MRRYRPFLALLLVAAAALSWWLLQQPRTQPERQVAQPGDPPREDLARVVPRLKECGGTDVVVTRLAQIVP